MAPNLRIAAVLLTILLGLASAACGSGDAADRRNRETSPDLYVPMFLRELANDEPTVRRNAAVGLGCIGAAAIEAVPALRCATMDPDQAVSCAAVAALELILAPKESKPARFPEIARKVRGRG